MYQLKANLASIYYRVWDVMPAHRLAINYLALL